MPQPPTPIPPDLLELSLRLEQWRSEQPARSRLPESIWSAAAGMAKRYGLHRTTKALRLDYARLKKRLPALAKTAGSPRKAFWNCWRHRREPSRVRGGVGIGPQTNARGHEARNAGLDKPGEINPKLN